LLFFDVVVTQSYLYIHDYVISSLALVSDTCQPQVGLYQMGSWGLWADEGRW